MVLVCDGRVDRIVTRDHAAEVARVRLAGAAKNRLEDGDDVRFLA